MALKAGDEIEVRIEKLVYGGSGLARYNQFVIFVPYTSPEEVCKVRLIKVKKKFAEAQKLKTLKPGPEQRQAPCEVFSICGGCHWQNTTYEEQLNQKHIIAKESIQEFYAGEIPMLYDKEWHYRNRIQVRAKENQIGFYKKNSHEIIDAKKCLITDKVLLEEINKLAVHNHAETTKYELFLDKDQQIHKSINKKHAQELGFSQVNTAINEKLIKHISTWIHSANSKQIYDLYCGKGNFSLNLSQSMQGLSITAVDISKANIDFAKVTDSAVSFVCEDVLQWLKSAQWPENALVIIDPPRIGADPEFLKLLAAKEPKHLIYISCNPSTLTRDLKTFFAANSDYYLSKATAFDMFPQTYHFEMAILLERK